MRYTLLAAAAIAVLCSSARADLVTNPLLFPSAALTSGNCIQATGPNTIATTGGPCGMGSGAGNVTGPTSSTIGTLAIWSNGTGTGLAGTTIQAASIPQLGSDQTWGGLNSFNQRPIFNDATPWDSANFNPALYLTTANAATTYLTQANAASTYLKLTGGTVPFLNLSNAAGVWKPISFNTGVTQRWQMGADNDGESGANAGSDFSLFAYADNGSVLANALHIIRATGVATFSARPVFGSAAPWDSANFNPANYLTTANAASTYLTIANAAATYTTPAEVNAALATFVTRTYADAHYLGIFNGQPVLGLGPFSNGISGNSTAASFIAESGGGSIQTVNLYPNATAGLAAAGFPSQALSSMVQAGDTALLAVANGGATFVVGAGATSVNSPAGIRFTTSGSGSIAMGLRPTFAGNLAWDAGNFNSALYLTTANAASTYLTIANAATSYLTPATAAATYLTQTNAASTYLTQSNATSTYATIAGVQSAYMRLSGGTFTGAVQFNQTPTIANQSLIVTDSSPDVPTTSWVQAVITNRVGTGPFIPTSGSGMPYDIQIGAPGPFVPSGGIPTSYAALTYVFVRNVTIPAGFAGSKLMARTAATASTVFNVNSSRFLQMGTVTFAAGGTSGTFSVAGGPYNFLVGDTLTIICPLSDTTLGGIFGNILAAMT